MSFDFPLDDRLFAGIADAGFTDPTPIQEQAIPHVLAGKDVMGLAQTGTGKTAAFTLPILQHLTTGNLRQVRVLIVAPTRELAEQIHEVITQLGKHTKIRSVPVYGGVGKEKQINALKKGVEVVVACPGRLLDLASEGHIQLDQVEVLVLDEADRMCDMGFLPDIKRIIKLLPAKRQTLFFSATMPKEVRSLSQKILKDPVTVQIGMIAPAKTVSHVLYPVSRQDKKKLLFALLSTTVNGRVLIFTRTKRRARYISRDIQQWGYKTAALEGDMPQSRRQRAMNGFRTGKYDILVATDVASRGIDVSDIAYVINFDMPDTVDAYTHRIGRTGRADESGEAITFMTEEDKDMVRHIERLLKSSIERRELPDLSDVQFPKAKPKKVDHKQNNQVGRGSRSSKPKRSGKNRTQRHQGQHRT